MPRVLALWGKMTGAGRGEQNDENIGVHSASSRKEDLPLIHHGYLQCLRSRPCMIKWCAAAEEEWIMDRKWCCSILTASLQFPHPSNPSPITTPQKESSGKLLALFKNLDIRNLNVFWDVNGFFTVLCSHWSSRLRSRSGCFPQEPGWTQDG